jgi:hypothetical protein
MDLTAEQIARVLTTYKKREKEKKIIMKTSQKIKKILR